MLALSSETKAALLGIFFFALLIVAPTFKGIARLFAAKHRKHPPA